nr:hypothetical protein [Candidatus Cloacimonadota bacterium]
MSWNLHQDLGLNFANIKPVSRYTKQNTKQIGYRMILISAS